jgi:hypothetical protein
MHGVGSVRPLDEPGFHRFAPDVASLRCATPDDGYGLAGDATVGRLPA